MSIKTVEAKLARISEEALLHLLGMGKAPGKVREGMSDNEKRRIFIAAMRNIGFHLSNTVENGAEIWTHKGQGGPWQVQAIVGKKRFSMRAVRKMKGERDMNHRPYSADIPARSPQDMKKYVKWVIRKLM